MFFEHIKFRGFRQNLMKFSDYFDFSYTRKYGNYIILYEKLQSTASLWYWILQTNNKKSYGIDAVEIYTFFSTWVCEFYFVYNSLNRLCCLLYCCFYFSSNDLLCWRVLANEIAGCLALCHEWKNNPIERKRNEKTYIFQLHDYLTYIIPNVDA